MKGNRPVRFCGRTGYHIKKISRPRYTGAGRFSSRYHPDRGKADIRDSEAGKIADIANYLKENKDAKVNIVGYADAGTGNDKINDRLAKKRADIVVKCLLEKYEIAADRISYDSKGARVQPFAENDMNRVTIMIAE